MATLAAIINNVPILMNALTEKHHENAPAIYLEEFTDWIRRRALIGLEISNNNHNLINIIIRKHPRTCLASLQLLQNKVLLVLYKPHYGNCISYRQEEVELEDPTSLEKIEKALGNAGLIGPEL